MNWLESRGNSKTVPSSPVPSSLTTLCGPDKKYSFAYFATAFRKEPIFPLNTLPFCRYPWKARIFSFGRSAFCLLFICIDGGGGGEGIEFELLSDIVKTLYLSLYLKYVMGSFQQAQGKANKQFVLSVCICNFFLIPPSPFRRL